MSPPPHHSSVEAGSPRGRDTLYTAAELRGPTLQLPTASVLFNDETEEFGEGGCEAQLSVGPLWSSGKLLSCLVTASEMLHDHLHVLGDQLGPGEPCEGKEAGARQAQGEGKRRWKGQVLE